MKIAVISDVHANIDALESVLVDIKRRKVDKIICTGDLVGYLPFPNEVVNCIIEHQIDCIKGNHDKKIAEHQFDNNVLKTMTEHKLQSSASLMFTSKTITDENRHYLNQLPESLLIKIDDVAILFVHGSPSLIDEYLYEDEIKLNKLSQEMHCDVLVFGHTHIPYHYRTNKKHFINPGSVGKPKHGNPSSAYVIINVVDRHISSEFIEVPYDTLNICRVIKNNSMIADDLIENIRSGT